jgi:hypothetical protein
MTTMSKLPHTVAAGLFGATLLATAQARAQSSEAAASEATPTDAIAVGEWLLRPTLQLRARGEARRNPFDTGGTALSPAAALPASAQSLSPPPAVRNQWLVMERARIGLSAERGPLRAVVELQDARVWGENVPGSADGRDALPNTGARLAFGELRGQGERASFLRLGRQELVWGEGRLIGRNDWSPTGRSLDALRGTLVLGDFDLEALAAVLVAPGALPPEASRGAGTAPEGPGAQLYGTHVTWHLAPLLEIEAAVLGRFVREPTHGLLTPSDLVAIDLRLCGRWLGLTYSAEIVHEYGRVAAIGSNRDIDAYAGVARVGYDTGVLGHLTLGAQAAYASGQKPGSDKVTRFDPILPDVRGVHGAMGLYGWSNMAELGASVGFTPWRESRVTLGWRNVSLAEPSDQWVSASLLSIGRDPGNGARTLGNEIDAALAYSPWEPLSLATGYGLFVTAEGAKAVLVRTGRVEADDRGRAGAAPGLQHYGYLQATLTVP